MTYEQAGSPPQVRGKQGYGGLTALEIGITPAGAGKTNGACILYNAA